MKNLKSLVLSIILLSSGLVYSMKKSDAELNAEQDFAKFLFLSPSPISLAADLIEAIKYHDEERAEELIQLGPDLTVKDQNGKTALDWANDWGNQRIIKLLKKDTEEIKEINEESKEEKKE